MLLEQTMTTSPLLAHTQGGEPQSPLLQSSFSSFCFFFSLFSMHTFTFFFLVGCDILYACHRFLLFKAKPEICSRGAAPRVNMYGSSGTEYNLFLVCNLWNENWKTYKPSKIWGSEISASDLPMRLLSRQPEKATILSDYDLLWGRFSDRAFLQGHLGLLLPSKLHLMMCYYTPGHLPYPLVTRLEGIHSPLINLWPTDCYKVWFSAFCTLIHGLLI